MFDMHFSYAFLARYIYIYDIYDMHFGVYGTVKGLSS